MAVPIEYCTVVFGKHDLAERFPGGLDAFFEFSQSGSYLEDEHLVRLSFMATGEASEFIDRTERMLCSHSAASKPLVVAVVDSSVPSVELPAWLRVGRIGSANCLWFAGASPGVVALPARLFAARFFRTPLQSFVQAIGMRGISVTLGQDGSSEVTFTREATCLDAHLGVDESGVLFGIITFPPSRRSPDPQEHERLLTDIESTLRNLGWTG